MARTARTTLKQVTRDSEAGSIIGSSLQTVRESLGMEVAYLSEFVRDKAIFRAVSAPGLEAIIRPSQSMDIGEVYCKHIIDGGLPRMMPDTSMHKIATDLPITQMIPIGSHVSVPVYRQDGTVFGMLCCLSRQPTPGLSSDDLDMMESYAAIVASQLTGPKAKAGTN